MIGEEFDNIKIELNEEDARLFVSFRKYQDVFKTMLDSGVFDTKSGSIILHFNLEGNLAKIDRNQVLFFLSVK